MFEPDLLARFTNHLKEALQKALAFSLHHGRDTIEAGDLLVALLKEKGSIGSELLQKAGASLEVAETTFAFHQPTRPQGTTIVPDLAGPVKQILEKCVLIAHTHEHKYIGTEHLLAALLEARLPDLQAYFEQQNVQTELLHEQITSILKSTSKFPDLSKRLTENTSEEASEEASDEAMNTPEPDQRARARGEKRPKALEVFARDLTTPEIASTLDPVIGRDPEIERVTEILCRRTKNNPILLGEPGVGKTAIVEGLAQQLAQGNVPDALQGKRLLAIDLALLVAGTMYRGEFEARLKQVVDEAKADKNIILFIDEIHNLVGAGSTSGSLDAANILKPALARGEIRCIGATTWAEYKKFIEPDAALERRYQPVTVSEPSPEATRSILQGLKKTYEEHHAVRYQPEALDAAVSLAERYLTDRFFPDKAIDLMDEAAAHAVASRRNGELTPLQKNERALKDLMEAKAQAVTAGDLNKAASYLREEKRLEQEKKRLEKQTVNQKDRPVIRMEEIAGVVSRLSHVPLETILATEHERLSSLEQRLNKELFGQGDAIRTVSDAIRRARLGLSDPKRPKASFLFVGPSGVGKTEMARLLARELFGNEDALIKIDMSEFSESHTVSKLIGSPAGYVGYRESNRFTDIVRRRPHSILLFDEFEKAHHDVQHLLLQILEDGKITDSTGKAVSLRQSYVVLTSNVGAEYVQRRSLGFQGSDDQTGFTQLVRQQLQERFRPELLNRLDHIAVFQPLGQDILKVILKKELEQVFKRLENHQSTRYSVTQDVLEWLAKRGADSEEGARAARRLIEKEVISLLTQELIKKPQKRTWKLQLRKDKLQVS